jgi:16S rRNA (cytosine1402-N4)-methyltransferase
LDQDRTAIESFRDERKELKESKANVYIKEGNYRNIDRILKELDITEVDGVLADLGWRIEQMSGNGKGFSFAVDEPLLMTYGDPKEYAFTAADILNEWEENDIRNVLKGYGEERYAGRIAGAIVEMRAHVPILHTVELADIVVGAVPPHYRRGKLHPATRTFQALRIAVNDELEALEELIHKSIQLLAPRGRLAIISFHSLEDRIVKHTFRAYAHDQKCTIITKKPITASTEEKEKNPRSRSAKLRILEKNEKA